MTDERPEPKPRFKIGTPFTRDVADCGGRVDACVVTDILRTYNQAGQMVHFCYVAQYMYDGKVKTDRKIHESVIVKGLIG